jgi:uncharacterized protein YdbL (DUF1318 family)
MSVQDRVKRYKSTGGGVGLVRVEVLVPTEDRKEILKLAADLRRQRRDKTQTIAVKPTVNRETVNDRAKLILHRLVARSLRANPALLDEARTRLQSLGGAAPDYVVQWARVLDRPAEEVADLIGSRSEHMTHLRVSSPFRLPEGFEDEAWRRRVWQKAKLGTAS